MLALWNIYGSNDNNGNNENATQNNPKSQGLKSYFRYLII
jgi:hypothetical protein